MKYSHYIFDFDGTLCDTADDIVLAINSVRERKKTTPLSRDYIISKVGNGLLDLTKKCFFDLPVDMEKTAFEIKTLYETFPPERVSTYPGILELIAQLKGSKIIVSNKPKRLIEPIIEKHFPSNSFSLILGGECLPFRKPSEKIFEHIQEIFSVNRKKFLMIGDGQPDIDFAQNSNIDLVFCRYGYLGTTDSECAYQINTPLEIFNFL